MPRTSFTVGVVTIGVVGCARAARARAATRRVTGRKLQLEQFFDFETVSNPRISPDGTQIVYTRGWVDKVNDRRSSALWIMGADGTEEPLPHHRLQRDAGRRTARGSRSRATASRPARRSGCAGWTPRAPPRRSRISIRVRRISRGRRTASRSRSPCSSRVARRGRFACRRVPRVRSWIEAAAHRREPDLSRRSAGLHRAGPESDLHWFQPKAVPSGG